MDDDWDFEYTNNALTEQLALLQLHYDDGSFRECSCVPEKHLPIIAGLASEAVMFTHKVGHDELTPFYRGLADWAREARKMIEEGDYSKPPNNDELRAFLPVSPPIDHKLLSCVEKAEKRFCKNIGDHTTCKYDPVAVCSGAVESHE